MIYYLKHGFVVFSIVFNFIYSINLLINIFLNDSSFESILWFATVVFSLMIYLDIFRNKACYEYDIFGYAYKSDANFLKEN